MMKHTVVITRQPVRSGKEVIPDGAVCGNGDLAAVLGSSGRGIRVYLGKSDLWCADRESQVGGIRPLGYVDIDIPAVLYNTVYEAQMRMDTADILCCLRDGFSFIETTVTVPAGANVVLVALKWSRNFHDPAPRLTLTEANGSRAKPFEENGVRGAYTDYAGEELVFETHAKTGIRKVAQGEDSAVYAVMTATNFDSPTYRTDGLALLETMDEAVVAKLLADHRDYWEKFYARSSVSISDESLELDWYASQYLLAVCRGKPMFPPGLYGNFITVDKPKDGGAYKLNSHYEAPFYAAVSSNHPELTDYYPDPLLAAVAGGRENAAEFLGCEGVYYPASIGPFGYYPVEDRLSPERMFAGQKFCASYAAVVMIMRWQGTRDVEYAQQTLYPYLAELVAFWDSFMKNEKGRYVIRGDAIEEIPYGEKGFKASKYKQDIRAKNSILSLGIVRMIYSATAEVASLLPDGEEMRAHCLDVLSKLSKYPVKHGHYVYTQKGKKKSKTGTVGIQHIYPMSQAGADKKSGKLSKKTVEKTKRWKDENGTSALYPAGARVGLSAETVLKHYKANREQFRLPNMLYAHEGGCLENVGLAAAMLNEMMLRSFDGIIRVFPNWDRSLDCEFTDLRANGAFLVSAKMQNGFISYVEITSEAGQPLTVANPFTAKAYGGCLARIGEDTTAVSGGFLEIDLAPGATVLLTPANTPVVESPKKEKKKAKKAKKKSKKQQKRAKKAVRSEQKDEKFYGKLEKKKSKKQAKKTAKKEKKINKKYAKQDKQRAKYLAKRRKKK